MLTSFFRRGDSADSATGRARDQGVVEAIGGPSLPQPSAPITLDNYVTDNGGVQSLGPDSDTKLGPRPRPKKTALRALMDRAHGKPVPLTWYSGWARQGHLSRLRNEQHTLLHDAGRCDQLKIEFDPGEGHLFTTSGGGVVDVNRLPSSGLIRDFERADLGVVSLRVPELWSSGHWLRAAWPLGPTKQSHLLVYSGGSRLLTSFDLEVCRPDRPTSVIGADALDVLSACFLPQSSDVVAFGGRGGGLVEMADLRVHSSSFHGTNQDGKHYRKSANTRTPICVTRQHVYAICPGDFQGRTIVVADDQGSLRLCDTRQISSSVGVVSMGGGASSSGRQSAVVARYAPRRFSDVRHDAVEDLYFIPSSFSSVAFQTIQGSCGAIDIITGKNTAAPQLLPQHTGVTGPPQSAIYQGTDGEWSMFVTNKSNSLSILPLGNSSAPPQWDTVDLPLGRPSSIGIGPKSGTVAMGVHRVGLLLLGQS